MVKFRILFVCLGNICRSPAAEAIFKSVISEKGLAGDIEVDSAGTSAWHAGEKADIRMRTHAELRGYELTSMARQFDPVADFGRFNLIIVMDDYIFSELEALAMTNDEKAKLRKMTDYCRKFGYTQVPDPFYGGEDGFELVLDLLEDACHGLYEEIIGNMA